MAVISVNDYQAIVNDYSGALTQLVGLKDNYYDAAYKVLLLNIFDPEIDLLVAYHNAYKTATVAYAAQPQSVVNAVRALQSHILAKGTDKDTGLKYTSINDYYADYSVDFTGFFTSAFASLSQQAGHTITNTYVA